MTSASDRTDDRIVVSPTEEGEHEDDARVIHASIVHDDEQDEAGADDEHAGYEPLHAGQIEDDEADDEAGDGPPWRTRSEDEQTPEGPAPGAEPRRAWVPEAPVRGLGGLGQPMTAASVPAQRAPFEAEPDEPDSDEPDSDQSVTEVPETSPSVASQAASSQAASSQAASTQTGPSQAVSAQSGPSQSGPSQPEADPTDLDQAEQAEPDEPELDELEPIEPVNGQPVSSQPVNSQPASTATAVGLTEPGKPEPASDSPWPAIQSMFVDDPRRAVEQAAQVTSTALADLIIAAKEQERTLRNDWQPDRTGTEELRVALRGYRDLSARIASLTRGF